MKMKHCPLLESQGAVTYHPTRVWQSCNHAAWPPFKKVLIFQLW